MKKELIICLIVAATRAFAADIPSDLRFALESSHLASSWALDQSVTPLYLKGDFTGTGKVDYAVCLKSKHGSISAVAIITDDKKAYLTSTEKDIGDNYPNPDWKIHLRHDPIPSRRDLNGRPPPVLKADAIELSKPESSSALLYLNAGHLHLYWLSD